MGTGRKTQSIPSQLVQVCDQAEQPRTGVDQDGNGSLGAEPEGLAAMPSSNQSQLCLAGKGWKRLLWSRGVGRWGQARHALRERQGHYRE